MNMNWQSAENKLLLNPRLSNLERQQAEAIFSAGSIALQGHLWVSTSGSSGHIKWVALSKEAILNSAKAVNSHLCSTSKDIWLNALPEFHVGGLGIWARAYVNGAKVITYDQKWDAVKFCSTLHKENITLTSLVPTQVFDLVQGNYASPKELRAIVVGGGALKESLYFEAVRLGWKVLPSYGLTECASQVATAELHSITETAFPEMKILSHHDVRLNQEGFLEVKSSSLLNLYGYFDNGQVHLIDPKIDGWFQTEDRVSISNSFLKVEGRKSDFIKIGGESVDLKRLENVLEAICLNFRALDEILLIAVPDERLGHVIHGVISKTENNNVHRIMEIYHERTSPFEKIRKIHCIDEIPRTSLGKIQKHTILKLIERT